VPLSALALAALLVLAPAGCHKQDALLTDDDGVAVASGVAFLRSPGRYRAERVRITRVEAIRIDITRPLVFRPIDPGAGEIVVSDNRALARQERLKVQEVVELLIDCTEGSAEHGNVLLAIERRGGGQR
jgi:hypothetical protein